LTLDDSPEVMTERLTRLAPLAPDAERARRVRARCARQLERGRRRAAHAAEMREFAARVLAPAAIGGFCVFYVAMLLAMTLRVHGLL
jgi:hypothetical protein